MKDLKKALSLFRGGRKTVAERVGIAAVNVDRVLSGEFNNENVIRETVKYIEEQVALANFILAENGLLKEAA